MTKEEIKKLETKKHVKIFLMHKLELSNKDIAWELNTNVGHVYNVLKAYKEDDNKVAAANKLIETEPV